MLQFYLQWPPFPLSWSHYVRLISIADAEARRYYEAEALRGGWSVRQLDHLIGRFPRLRTSELVLHSGLKSLVLH